MEITTKTQVCALIGNPVTHSLSPAIHNAAFNALGLDFVYVAFKVTDCRGAIEGLKAFDQLKGFSVTIPHKIGVRKYLNWIEDVAQKIGSVNTVVKENGLLKGYNTDGFGALKAIEEARVTFNNNGVLILGSGGVARTIAFSLLMSDGPPKSLKILGVEKEQGRGLASDLIALKRAEVSFEEISEDNLAKEIKNAQLLINCTPIGMWPHIEKSIVPEAYLHSDLAVFDVVYNPLKTKLITYAENRGCKTVSGLTMFINQAVGQFDLWTKRKAPFEIMKQKAMEYLKG